MGGGGQTEGEDHEYSVRAVTFSIFGTDEIKSVSTMEVNERTLYSAPGGVGGSDRRPSEQKCPVIMTAPPRLFSKSDRASSLFVRHLTARPRPGRRQPAVI